MVKPDYLEKLYNAIVSGGDKDIVSICKFYKLYDKGELVKYIEKV